MILPRSLWVNGNMDVWQKGTSMAAPAAQGGYICDFTGYRGRGSTVFVERMNFPLGQTDVPGNPPYFMRTAVDSVPGVANYAVLGMDFDGVQNFNGSRSATFFWAKADRSVDVVFAYDQHFGLGGSPSTDVLSIPSETAHLTTSWQRFTLMTDWPSVAGKTIGTSLTDTDRIGIAIYLDAGSNFNARANNLGQQDIVFDFARAGIMHDPDSVVQYIIDPYQGSPEEELAKCQTLLRVFKANEIIWSGDVTSGQNYWLGVPVGKMRRKPVPYFSLTNSSGFTTTGSNWVSAASVTDTGVQIKGSANATGKGFFQGDLILDANHPYTP